MTCPIKGNKKEIKVKMDQTTYSFQRDIDDFKNIIMTLHDIFGRVKNGSPYKLTGQILRNLTDEKNISQINTMDEQYRFYRLLHIILMRARDYSLERDNGAVEISINFAGDDIRQTFTKWNEFYIQPTIEKIQRRLNNLPKEGNSYIYTCLMNSILRIEKPEDILRICEKNIVPHEKINSIIDRLKRRLQTAKLFQDDGQISNQEQLSAFYQDNMMVIMTDLEQAIKKI